LSLVDVVVFELGLVGGDDGDRSGVRPGGLFHRWPRVGGPDRSSLANGTVLVFILLAQLILGVWVAEVGWLVRVDGVFVLGDRETVDIPDDSVVVVDG